MSKSTSSVRIPSYRKHKPTGQAVVTLNGRDIYLGKHNSAASRMEYNRLIAEYAAGGGTLPSAKRTDYTIAELLVAYFKHANEYYRDTDGTPTSEIHVLRLAMRPLKELYGRTPAADFGPLALKAVRQKMIEADWSRGVVNASVNRLRRIFKWATENELLEPSVLHGLQAVSGLRKGRSVARETEPVKPVPDAFVDAVLPHVSRQVGAMIELQRLTGMRSGEVTIMRGCDLDTSGKVWVYCPESHKTAHHGHARNVYLGPKAQEVVRPFLKADIQAYLFSPADSEAERNEQRFGVFSPDRKTPVYPSEVKARERRRAKRAKRSGKRARPLGNRYDTNSYRRAIKRGLGLANKALLAEAKEQGIDESEVALIPHWHPHQLRHNAATNLRKEYGIEVARIILGHRSAAITEVYAEVDHAAAIKIMGEVG